MWVGGGGGVPILVISLKIKLTLIKNTLFVKCSPKTNAKPYNGKQLKSGFPEKSNSLE